MHEITVRLSPAVNTIFSTNREQAHVHVMSAFPHIVTGVVTDSQGVTRRQGPREALGIIWHHNARNRTLVVHSKEPAESPGLLGEIIGRRTALVPVPGMPYDVHVLLACQKTPPSDVPPEIREQIKNSAHGPRSYRSRKVVVPELERIAWATRKLRRIGFSAEEDPVVSSLQTCPLGKRGHAIPAVEVSAHGRVTDLDAFTPAYADGTGAGRNYGLGLIRLAEAAPR
jgi:hypothetical protein